MTKWLKPAILGGLATLATTGQTAAADPVPLPVQTQIIIQEPEPHNWTGLFWGINGGLAGRQFVYPYAYDDPNIGNTPLFEGQFAITAGGFIAGSQLGFNVQAGRVVFGAVADINWSGYKGELNFVLSVPPAPFTIDIAAGTRLDWYGTVRARLGLVGGDGDRFLLYATGGLAYGSITPFWQLAVSGGGPTVTLGDDDQFFDLGWALGGGAEFAINDRFSFHTEYLFLNFGNHNFVTINGLPPAGNSTFTFDQVTRVHTIKAGFNIYFGDRN